MTLFSGLFLVKFLVAVGLVVGLSLVAEFFGPRLAGLISGYPLAAALNLIFFALEQGRDFAALAALHSFTGLLLTLAFATVYQALARGRAWGSLLLSFVASLLVYLGLGILLKPLDLPAWGRIALALAGLLAFHLLLRSQANLPLGPRLKLSPRILAIRALAGAGMVLLITGLAKSLGPIWAGLLATFPVTVSPLLLILHRTYGVDPVKVVAKNLPKGLGAVFCFVLVTWQGLPGLGILKTNLLAFLAATLYLAGVELLPRFFPQPASAAPQPGEPCS